MGQFDPTQVKQLVDNLISGESDLTAKQQANADVIKSSADSVAKSQAALAKSQADASDATAKAAGDLQAAQATNRANVQAVKQYFDSLDTEGNEPDPNADTGTVTDTGGTSEVADNPASNTNATEEPLRTRR